MKWFRRKDEDADERRSKIPVIGLDEAIDGLRADLTTAINRSAGQPVQFPIDKMTVELDVLATKSVDGKARFKVPIVEVELGGKGRRMHANTQKVTVEFGSPVDQGGQPVKATVKSDDR